jgi:type IV pilus assembly protein PilN
MTIRINLLDWRRERREQRKREFTRLLALGFVGGAGFVVLALSVVNTQLGRQNTRNDYLRTQIQEMDKRIAEIKNLEELKAKTLARMQVIEGLQASRSNMVHFFDQLVETLPDGVHLRALKDSGSSVKLDGLAESNARISSYMKSLDGSAWFANPRLVVIKTTDSGQRRTASFQLEVSRVADPNAPQDPDADLDSVEESE